MKILYCLLVWFNFATKGHVGEWRGHADAPFGQQADAKHPEMFQVGRIGVRRSLG